MKQVGVLALQGDFAAHEERIAELGAEAIQIRNADQLKSIDGLIIPGGESTSMLKLLHYDGMMEPLAQFFGEKPVFGTCAGAILMAKDVSRPTQESFSVMDISIERNGYGRQNDSRIVDIEPEDEFAQRAGSGVIETVFIRAPIIRRTGPEVKVLVRYDGNPILIEQGRHMAATFHPELTDDARVHQWFLRKL